MNNVTPFNPAFGVHTCEDPCFARALCQAKKEASTLEDMVSTAEKLEEALGMGPTPCQMVGFVGEYPL